MKERPIFKIILSEEADSFIQSLPIKVGNIIRSNIRRIQKGERKGYDTGR